MPIVFAVPISLMLWLLAAWLGNDTACAAINTVNHPGFLKFIEKALLACFI